MRMNDFSEQANRRDLIGQPISLFAVFNQSIFSFWLTNFIAWDKFCLNKTIHSELKILSYSHLIIE